MNKEAIDKEAVLKSIVENFKEEQLMEVGEWIAKRLLENSELIKTIPPLLWAFYQTYLQIYEQKRYNESNEHAWYCVRCERWFSNSIKKDKHEEFVHTFRPS